MGKLDQMLLEQDDQRGHFEVGRTTKIIEFREYALFRKKNKIIKTNKNG
jgi:hypothetical protein